MSGGKKARRDGKMKDFVLFHIWIFKIIFCQILQSDLASV